MMQGRDQRVQLKDGTCGIVAASGSTALLRSESKDKEIPDNCSCVSETVGPKRKTVTARPRRARRIKRRGDNTRARARGNSSEYKVDSRETGVQRMTPPPTRVDFKVRAAIVYMDFLVHLVRATRHLVSATRIQSNG